MRAISTQQVFDDIEAAVKAIREYQATVSAKEKSPADYAIAILKNATPEDREAVRQWLAGV